MGDTASYSTKGEAVAVDLGKGRYLFMLLTRPDELARYAFDDTKESTGTIIVQDHIASLKPGTSAILKRKYYPPLVTFADVSDPKTVKEVDPDNLAATFGPGFALKDIQVEMTDEKVTSNLEKVLGWVRTLRGSIGKDMHLPYSDLLNKLNDGSFIQGEKT